MRRTYQAVRVRGIRCPNNLSLIPPIRLRSYQHYIVSSTLARRLSRCNDTSRLLIFICMPRCTDIISFLLF